MSSHLRTRLARGPEAKNTKDLGVGFDGTLDEATIEEHLAKARLAQGINDEGSVFLTRMLYSIPELKCLSIVPHIQEYRAWRASHDRI